MCRFKNNNHPHNVPVWFINLYFVAIPHNIPHNQIILSQNTNTILYTKPRPTLHRLTELEQRHVDSTRWQCNLPGLSLHWYRQTRAKEWTPTRRTFTFQHTQSQIHLSKPWYNIKHNLQFTVYSVSANHEISIFVFIAQKYVSESYSITRGNNVYIFTRKYT